MDNDREIIEVKKELVQQRRRLHLSTLGMVAALSLFALSSASGLQDLRVRRLALIDAKGVERLILVADSKIVTVNGRVYERNPAVSGIILQNTKGDEVGGFGTGDNGSVVMMLDGYSKEPVGESERVGMFVMPDGTAGFRLNDLEGRQKVSMSSGPDRSVEFEISHGKRRLDGDTVK